MSSKNKIKVFLVDDDALFLKALELEFLNHDNFLIETFLTGELCISALENNPDMIVLDYLLDNNIAGSMNGLATLDKIKSFNNEIPVIIFSAQDKIEVAVNCMHHKALDYIVKSETAFLRVKKLIDMAIHYKKIEKELNWYMEKM